MYKKDLRQDAYTKGLLTQVKQLQDMEVRQG